MWILAMQLWECDFGCAQSPGGGDGCWGGNVTSAALSHRVGVMVVGGEM